MNEPKFRDIKFVKYIPEYGTHTDKPFWSILSKSDEFIGIIHFSEIKYQYTCGNFKYDGFSAKELNLFLKIKKFMQYANEKYGGKDGMDGRS